MTTTPTTPTPSNDYLRNTDLATLAASLNDHRARAMDVVAPASAVRMEGGAIVLDGTQPEITEDGVTLTEGRYMPTRVADEGISARLDIPLAYLRRMRTDRLDLLDDNVNGWLRDSEKSFMFRLLRNGDGMDMDGNHGLARAVLSDRYRVVDNFDVLLATLQGVRQAGTDQPDITCDLTERAMVVRIKSTGVAALAPQLLAGYRSPFSGQTGADNPTVFAGLVIRNSETGNGAFTITPRLVVQICNNGMTMVRDAQKEIHLGGQLDSGIVRWSDATLRRNLDLVTSKTADAVSTFLSVEYVTAKIAELERDAGVRLADAQKVITTVAKDLAFSETQKNEIMAAFIEGGTVTSGGVMHAVTAAAQKFDGDTAYAMESVASRAMVLAARAAR